MKDYTLDQYQLDAARTAKYPGRQDLMGLVYTVLGMGGEAGEFANKVKKIIRDKQGVVSKDDREELAKELGDVLWYVSNTALELGFSLSDIAEMNREKLYDRMERGAISGSGDNR